MLNELCAASPALENEYEPINVSFIWRQVQRCQHFLCSAASMYHELCPVVHEHIFIVSSDETGNKFSSVLVWMLRGQQGVQCSDETQLRRRVLVLRGGSNLFLSPRGFEGSF